MANFKVITRGEVNELVPGTFSSDLNKAVLYSELSENPAFIVSSANKASGLQYTPNQALLEADIQVVSDVYIRLTITQNPVAANATSNTFIVVTNGIDNSTLGWDQAGSSWVTACTVDGTNLTGSVGFPANTMYNPNTVTVSVTGTSVLGETVTGTVSFVQSRVEVTPSLSIEYTGSNVSSASGNTNAFNITANYVTVTGYTVTSPASVDISATGATTVKINYPANTAESTRTFTVTARGRDVYGAEKTATCTFTQSSDAYTFSLSPSSSIVEFTTTSKTLTINKSNVNDVAVCAHTNTTSETINGNNLILGFNINHETYERTISVTLSGRTAGGRAVSCSAAITQSGASGLNLAIVYGGNALPAASGTTNEFSISAGENVTVTGYSVDVAGARMENTGATQTTLRYPANPTNSPVTYTVTVYASTPTGNTSASTTVTQAADAYSFVLSATTNPIGVASTTAPFALTGTSVNSIGFYQAESVNVTGISGLSSNAVTATGITPNTSQSPKTITLVLSGVTVGGRTVYATGTTTQSADSYTFALAPVTNPISASATTAAFNLTATSISNIGYYAAQSSNVSGISGLSSNSVTATGITKNTSNSQKQIKLVLSGKTAGGATVYATGTTMQNADTYTLSLTPDANPIAAETTLALFTITSSNVSNLRYVASGSENVVSCTVSGRKARATITANQGPDRNITVRISGTTVGGRTVYATATTVQSAPSSYTFDLIPVGGEMSYVAASATSHTYEIRSTNINDETIGVVTGGTTSDANFDYNTGIGTFDTNTGDDREVTIQISAKTLADETVYADATVIQLGAHSETDFISVTPDGTAINAAATSVTFNISWNYAKVGTNITFSVASGITTAPASIAVTSISGSSATTVNISANTGSSNRRPTLTASMTDVVSANHSDSGYYTQATSRSNFEFQNDFTVEWDVTSATITFTYAYLTNSNVSLAATGGAYFNSGLTQPSSSVSITPNASSRTGSFTIYFAKNDSSPTPLEYVITATGNYGEAGESTPLSDSITVTHNIPDGASLVLTPCSTTYYWDTTNVTFNLGWTNIRPGTSSNPGITITVSNGATATPNKYYSGNDGDEDFVVSGFAPGNSYTVTVTGKPYVGDDIVRTYTITIPAKPAAPDIWWTKTFDGSSATEVTSIDDVPAYVPNTYDGRNVTYIIYINYNSDVTSVSMDTSSLIDGASASTSGKIVTITAPVNGGNARSLGSITVRGIAQGGVYDEATLSITQEGYVENGHILIEGLPSYTPPNNVSYTGGTVTYGFEYFDVVDVGVSNLTLVTGATADTATSTLSVGFMENASDTRKSWGVSVTGRTAIGNVISATIIGYQDGGPHKSCTFNFKFQPNDSGTALAAPVSVNNASPYEVIFEDAQAGSSFYLYLPWETAGVGVGFEGKVLANDTTGEVSIGGSQGARQGYNSGEDMNVRMTYTFVGTTGSSSQSFELNVRFEANGKTKSCTISGGRSEILDLSDWFKAGNFNVDVFFDIVVNDS